MGSFTDYRGLNVRTPDPVGDAGLILNNNFKELADRSGPIHSAATDPDANDDSVDTNGNGKFYLWSKWLNTLTNTIFICTDATVTAAVWTASTVSLGIGGKIIIDGIQVLYLPDQSDFDGTVIYGDGGNNLSTSASPDGKYNVAIGLGALTENTEGDSNIAIGYQAVEDTTTGQRNVGIGYRAVNKNITGDNNVAVGDESLMDNTAGDENVCLGNMAGQDITGNGNICIGYQAAVGQIAISNRLYIDNSNTATPLIYGEFDNDLIKINGDLYIPSDSKKLYLGVDATDYTIQWDGSDAVHTITAGDFVFTGGNVGIGMADPAFKLEINGKFGIDDKQIIYLPNQTDFVDTLIIGDGGSNLSHTGGTEGYRNMGVGFDVFTDLTTGEKNVGVGRSALANVSTGDGNVAIGYRAAYKLTFGDSNMAIGAESLNNITIQNSNVAIGAAALYSCIGSFNIAVGATALRYTGNAASNTGIGANALLHNTTGNQNVGIGRSAGYNKQTGDDNIFIGQQAGNGIGGLYNTEKNVIIGVLAGYTQETGALNNIFIGWQAGYTTTTGHDNIIIGHDIDASAIDANNELNIGGIIKGDTNANEVYFSGEIWHTSPTSGGGLRTMMAEAVGTAGAAQTFIIQVNVPAGARIIGCQLRVDVILASGDGGVSWEAELDGGVAHTLGGGYAFAKDTQAMVLIDASAATIIANAEVDITVTCDSAKNFQAGGQVRAIVYYQDLVPMDAAP